MSFYWLTSLSSLASIVFVQGVLRAEGLDPQLEAANHYNEVGYVSESAAYPNGTFGEQLSAAQGGTGHGVGGSHRRHGPGRKDDWKVGPHWRVQVDGGVLFREDADLAAIIGAATPAPPAPEFQDNFDHALAGRLLLTGEWPQCRGYELQFGYLGAEAWSAPVVFPQDNDHGSRLSR